MPKGVRIIKGLNLKNENMVSLIFTLKKSVIKSFGFEKKVYGSVQYISVMWCLRILFHEGELRQYENH